MTKRKTPAARLRRKAEAERLADAVSRVRRIAADTGVQTARSKTARRRLLADVLRALEAALGRFDAQVGSVSRAAREAEQRAWLDKQLALLGG